MDEQINCVALELRRPMPLVLVQRKECRRAELEELSAYGLLSLFVKAVLLLAVTDQRSGWKRFGRFEQDENEKEGN